MNVKFEFDHNCSKQPLLVNVDYHGHTTCLNLQNSPEPIIITLDLPVQNQLIDFYFSCQDTAIRLCPLTVTNVILDDFYVGDKLVYRGVPKFDSLHLDYAKKYKLYLDPAVADCNRLDFTGQLHYQFVWPFYKNLYQ